MTRAGIEVVSGDSSVVTGSSVKGWQQGIGETADESAEIVGRGNDIGLRKFSKSLQKLLWRKG